MRNARKFSSLAECFFKTLVLRKGWVSHYFHFLFSISGLIFYTKPLLKKMFTWPFYVSLANGRFSIMWVKWHTLLLSFPHFLSVVFHRFWILRTLPYLSSEFETPGIDLTWPWILSQRYSAGDLSKHGATWMTLSRSVHKTVTRCAIAFVMINQCQVFYFDDPCDITEVDSVVRGIVCTCSDL